MSTNGEADGRLPADDQEFEELAIAEEELIDAYVLNKLPADERNLLKKGLLNSPRLVERLHFARLLAKEVSSLPQPQISVPVVEPEASGQLHGPADEHIPRWKSFLGSSLRPAFQMVLAAGIILVFLGDFALLAGWMKLHSETQRLDSKRAALETQIQELEKKSAEQQSKSDQLSAELQKAGERREQDQKLIAELKRTLSKIDQSNSQAAASTVASILLLPGLTRDVSGGNELVISPGSSKISIRLGLETADYPSYRAVIKNSQGLQITKTGLKPRRSRFGKILLFQVPANRLPSGDYVARVSGITSSGVVDPVYDYALRVRRKQD